MTTHWSDAQETGPQFGIRLLFFVYRYIGRWAFAICLYPTVTYFYLSNSTARHASLKFLKKVQMQGALPRDANLRLLSFKHFLAFGHCTLDKLSAWTNAFNYDNVAFTNRADFLQMVDRGKGALIIVSHLGNQEVCRALADTSRRVKLNILVHTKHAEKFNSMMRELANGSACTLIQVTEFSAATAIMLKEKLDRGEVVVIAGDRTPVNSNRQLPAEFLGESAFFPQGPFIMAAVLSCPVYLMFCLRKAEGYEIFFEEFAQRIKLNRKAREREMSSWVQKYADRLAFYTLTRPLQWNNFYDFWADPKKKPGGS